MNNPQNINKRHPLAKGVGYLGFRFLALIIMGFYVTGFLRDVFLQKISEKNFIEGGLE
jgi:hypothetical protein